MKVIVVGGGIVGARLSEALASEGVKVTLLEARYFTYGATGRSTGSITVQQRKPELVKLALQTKDHILAFQKKAAELGVPFAQRFMNDDSPHIAVAFNEEEYEDLKKLAAIWREAGAEVIEADPEKAKEYFPQLDPNAFYKAFITPNDYKVMPHPVTWAFIAAARIQGAETYTFEEVVKAEVKEEGVRVVTNTGKEFTGDAIVVAAGAASPKVLALLGDEPGVEVKPMYAAGLVTEPFKYTIKPTIRVHSQSFRFLQTVRKEFVATIDNMGFENPELSTEDSLEFLERASTLVVKLLPAFAYVNILRSWGAFVDFTADDLPVVGWSTKYPGKVYHIYGFNDYGLSVGPVAAAKAAKEIASGTKDPDLEAFRPRRA
ncbi:MAG: FAD-binding oxidoreductase [Desulfurococcales archaeon]|nr:FAD-binding oxidoreductase [Desulfurococcales archaeon]